LPLCGAEKHPSPQSCASDTCPPCSSSASVLQHDHHTQFVGSSFIQQTNSDEAPTQFACELNGANRHQRSWHEHG
jgi:hypothetical protein